MSERFLTFFKSLLKFPHKLFLFPYRSKTNEQGVEYASQFLRSSSILIDLIILFCLFQAIYFLVNFAIDLNGILANLPLEILEKAKLHIPLSVEDKIILASYKRKAIIATAIIQLIQLAILIIGVTYMWHRFGGTPGKLLLGLRVVDKNSLKYPAISKCIKRFFMFPVSALTLFLGIIWATFDKDAQTWHDKIANTVVVKKSTLPKF